MNQQLGNKITAKTKAIESELISIRRKIHANPETAYCEEQTAALICDQLEAQSINFKSGVAGTGVVAVINEHGDGNALAFRAEMDALPIQEEADLSFRSKIPGKMHACGHDVHSCCGLGVAWVLQHFKDELGCPIKIIFQPSEEKLPSGAKQMIEEGVLENPKISAILAMHVSPELEAGRFGFRNGAFMASADEVQLVFKGEGGHAARPHQGHDMLNLTAQFLIAAQHLADRTIDPAIPSVLTFGKLEALGATNVIPNEAKLAGTFRCMDETTRFQFHGKLKGLVKHFELTHGLSIHLDIVIGSPVLLNNEILGNQLKEVVYSGMGKESVVDLPIRLGAEDFAYFTHKVPSYLLRLGTGFKDRKNYGLHHPKFEVNEEAITNGVAVISEALIRLSQGGLW